MPNFKEILSFKKKLSNFDINRHLQDFKNKKDTGVSIVAANIEQLWNGKTVSGNDIKPDYFNSNYANYKWFIGGQFTKRKKETPNLRLTGAFYNSIKLSIESNKIEIIATDEKTPELLAKYGDILGLSEESKLFISELFKEYIEKVLENIK